MPPSSDQRLLEDHPAKTISVTPNDTRYRTQTRPTCMFAAWRLISRSPMRKTSPKGIATKVMSAGTKAMIGARVCNNLSAPGGTKSSLVNNLMGSHNMEFVRPRLNGRTPKMLARLAPIRSCIKALAFLSTHAENIALMFKAMKSTMKVRMNEIVKSIIALLSLQGHGAPRQSQLKLFFPHFRL